MTIIHEWYWDCGPSPSAEKLREVYGIMLGRETPRLWMIEAGLWLDCQQRRKRVHCDEQRRRGAQRRSTNSPRRSDQRDARLREAGIFLVVADTEIRRKMV